MDPLNNPLGKLRILLVDDHEIVRNGVRTLIEREAGWEVCGEAADGRTAVTLAEKLEPDVVVLDIGLPELNGARRRAADQACAAEERGADLYRR